MSVCDVPTIDVNATTPKIAVIQATHMRRWAAFGSTMADRSTPADVSAGIRRILDTGPEVERVCFTYTGQPARLRHPIFECGIDGSTNISPCVMRDLLRSPGDVALWLVRQGACSTSPAGIVRTADRFWRSVSVDGCRLTSPTAGDRARCARYCLRPIGNPKSSIRSS